MPRNVSGVYSPPAATAAVSGATISSSAYNTLIDDIGDEITASLPVSGSAGMTGQLKVSDGSAASPAIALTSATNRGFYKTTDGWGISVGGVKVAEVTSAGLLDASGTAYQVTPTIAWADVASAATTDIGAVASSNIRITGTTTITAFGTVATGTTKRIRFAAALTLTYNATSLILPTAASITTAANDSCVAVSLGSGNWIVVDYMKANGTPLSFSGAVTSVTAGSGLSGGTITSTGTVAIDTNNSVGVGALAFLQNGSGGTITNGSTAAGSNLTVVYSAGGSIVNSATTVSGTWRNVSGISLQNAWSGMWIRVS